MLLFTAQYTIAKIKKQYTQAIYMLEIIRFHMTLMHLRENVCFHLFQCKIVSHGSATMKKLFRIFIFYSFITRRTLNKCSINQQFFCISYFISIFYSLLKHMNSFSHSFKHKFDTNQFLNIINIAQHFVIFWCT